MSSDEEIDISSSSENEAVENGQNEQTHEPTRKDILSPVVHSTVAALGGVETDTQTNVTRYVLGDDCLGCLRDLKKLWRKDDTDDERTVARIFWETRVLVNDLVPILIETAGGGVVGDKRAVACADVIAAMTWPIDVAEELKELDEQHDEKTDYATLLLAQLHYKEALARPEVLKALQNIMMPSIAKDRRSRVERDNQIISLVLHIFRNLLALKDPPRTSSSLSSSSTSLSSLQSRLLVAFRTTGLFDLFLTCASNIDRSEFAEFSAVLLEISYLLVRGVGVRDVVRIRGQAAKKDATGGMVGDGEDEELRALLEREQRDKKMSKRGAPTRHSRFGTTITLKANKEHYVLHRQEAITADPSQMIDMVKKKRAKKTVRADEVGVFNPLSSDALSALAGYSTQFIESCFNIFMASVLKDIKAERPKFTEKDNLRLLFLTKWFLEFYLLVREEQEKDRKQRSLFSDGQEVLPFGYVSEVVEHAWAPWVLRRMRAAVEEKPKQWVELHAGMDCLAQMLNLITLMAQDPDEAIQEAAETLQHQIYYNGEALDVALDGLRGYKDQSIAYLDSAVHLAFVLLRMLEKWANSQGEMYVRKRKKKSKAKKAKGVSEEEGVVDVESDENPEGDKAAADELIHEQMFVFEKYEAKFAQEDIANACLVYLARWREFTSSEQMRRIVSLLHRQAIKAKAEGFFFKVSTLELFQSILKAQASFPKDQPHKDLIQLINFILRKFFKSAKEHPMLLVEAFYPKNRGQWKAYSSYIPEVKTKATRPAGRAELAVKKGLKSTEQIGVAVACLVEEENKLLIDWVVDVLKRVVRKRQDVIDTTDVVEDPPSDEDEEAAAAREAAKARKVPSKEAIEKFEDYRIPYVEDHHAEAATSNKYLKLLMRLVGFTCEDDEALELEWHVPPSLLPSELQTSQNVIEQYLANPIDLQGKKAKDHLTTKRGTRRQREVEPSSSESGDLPESGEDDFLPNDGPSAERRAARKAEREERRAAKRRAREEHATSKKREKKKKETAVYKSAEMIVDSDAELGDDEEFFARERELMGRAKKAGEGGSASATMQSHGTKKRAKKESKGKRKGKRSREEDADGAGAGAETEDGAEKEGEVEGGLSDSLPDQSRPKAKPKPRPRPKPKSTAPVVESGAEDSDTQPVVTLDAVDEPAGWNKTRSRPRPRMRVAVESDAEGEAEQERPVNDAQSTFVEDESIS